MNNLSEVSKRSVFVAIFCVVGVTLAATMPARAREASPSKTRKVFGLTRALVTDVRDPMAAGRIKVKFPSLPGETSVWARVMLPLGNRTGLRALPEVGDGVIVGFENGDPSHPIVLGSLWNGNAPPNPGR